MGTAEGRGATRTLVALVVAVFGYALMQTVVVPALKLLEVRLHATPTTAAWILTAFLLSSAVLTPLLGRLGDLFGRRRVTLAVLAVYAVGMAGAAAAQNIGQLIAARAVQGAALALVPLSMAILREALPANRLPFAMGLVSGAVGAGGGAGLVVGGLLADHLSWRYLFILGTVIALVSLLLAALWVPVGGYVAAGRADYPGAVLLGGGLVALLLALAKGPSWGWSSPRVLGLFALGAVLFAVLAGVERARNDALLDVGELSDRPMAMTHAAAFLFGAGSYFFYLALPLYAQLPAVGGVGFGSTITVAGLLMLPGMLAVVPASMAVGRIARVLGPRWPLTGGWALFGVGSVLFVLAHDQMWQHAVFYTIVGAGTGLVIGSLPKLIADIVPLARTGTANGINNIARTVGSAVGTALAAAVIASAGTGRLPDSTFTTLFWLAAATAALGIAIGFFATRRDAPAATPTREELVTSR
ncbi:MFS transporter [Phytohabitans sp. ZYX-F-186]|uniref:MFS transporter n=1 Tax=Phytohabitans maris TaxID=3071409 RepID=A0ABU0ZDL5_9ACTN|nr:MFS transporter [Phytohabitans sp. ZYX-F-186]MDQ7905145.1 MFS transporter [Phytohabitans sp. ZYX-F-186]